MVDEQQALPLLVLSVSKRRRACAAAACSHGVLRVTPDVLDALPPCPIERACALCLRPMARLSHEPRVLFRPCA